MEADTTIDLLAPVGTLDILPSSVQRVPTNFQYRNGWIWVPIFCANCGCDGGLVPEDTSDFAFYLCGPQQNDCATKFGPIAGTLPIPDEVFWAKVKEEQMAQRGRDFTPDEMLEAINNSDNPLAKLARDRYSLPEYKRR